MLDPTNHVIGGFTLVDSPAMQIKFVSAVALDAELTALRSRFILQIATILAFEYVDRKGEAFPGKGTLAALVDADLKSVYRALQALEQYGYLADTGRRRGSATVYELRIPDRASAPDQRPSRSGARARRQTDDRAPVSAGSGAGVSAIGHGCPAHIEEPTSEPTFEPSPHAPKGDRGEVCELSDQEIASRFIQAWGFDDPTDRKEPALRLLAEEPREEQLAAIRAAPRYREACRARNRKPCHAKTWIRDRGWAEFDVEALPHQELPQEFVEEGTPQAAAWSRHYANTTGRKMFMVEMNAPGGRRAVGRYEHTAWPPGWPVCNRDRMPPGSALREAFQ